MYTCYFVNKKGEKSKKVNDINTLLKITEIKKIKKIPIFDRKRLKKILFLTLIFGKATRIN
jgi:hypothetical protein